MRAEIAAQLAARQKQFLSFLQPRLGDRATAEDVLQAAWLKAAEKADTGRSPAFGMPPRGRMRSRSSVCGMEVDPSRPKGGTVLHEGQLYGFCNAKWRSCSPRRRKGERVPTLCPR